MKDKEAEITLGELGINRFSSLKVDVESFTPAEGMAACMINLDFQKYILHLRTQGIIIAVASSSDPMD